MAALSKIKPAKAKTKTKAKANATRPTPTLALSADYGTSNLSISYKIVNTDAKGGETPLEAISFGGHFQVPQQIAWDEGTFLCGHAVARAVNARRIQPGDVITQWKLRLYPELSDSDLAKRVDFQLRKEGKTLETLLAEHIKAIVGEAKSVLKGGQTGNGFSKHQIDTMPVKLLLSVPMMWEVPESHKMATAAKEAGVDHVDILFEPQCAAAFILDDVIKRKSLSEDMKEGSVILVADPGGGTGDFVAYLIIKGKGGLGLDLRKIGNARGSLCGSQFVNMRFLGHLRKQACEDDGSGKTFEQRCHELGRTEQDVYKIAMDAFEAHKVVFAEDTIAPMDIVVGGAPVAPGQRRSKWTVEITSAEMRSFFQPVIDDIMQQIDNLLGELVATGNKATHIAVVGGMRWSPFFMGQINAKYGETYKIIGDGDSLLRSTHVVAHGAHLRYDDIKAETSEAVGFFGIEQDELYDANVHGDLSTLNPCHIEEIHGETYIKRRWQPMDKSGELWQQNYIRPHQKDMKRQIWWTRDELPRGAQMITDDGRHYRDVFVPIGNRIVKKCPKWKDEGFKLHYLDTFGPPVDGVNSEDEFENFEDFDIDHDSDMDWEEEGSENGSENGSEMDTSSEGDRPRSQQREDEPAEVSRQSMPTAHGSAQTDQHPHDIGASESTRNSVNAIDDELLKKHPDKLFAPTPAQEIAIRNQDDEIDPMDEFIKRFDKEGVTNDGRKYVSKAVYEPWSRLTVESDGANVSFRWVIARPGTEPYDQFGKLKPKEGKGKAKKVETLGEEEVIELVDASFSPYARG
ncbi:hypothetical protein PRZ48_012548 [Zasmidium cellare]|uniref:Uncharacterized protein n=1 Tax=Zasmidium cellare TaxID=395010 RepID=A0ABR0E5L9_ZASCE|nr:hypothetical protein PRZ48_012548 [Zasmidium cellare]